MSDDLRTSTVESTLIGNIQISGNISYVVAAKSKPQPVFPKREHAIIIHSEPNIVLHDYVKALVT